MRQVDREVGRTHLLDTAALQTIARSKYSAEVLRNCAPVAGTYLEVVERENW